jgi:hypothetical protein
VVVGLAALVVLGLLWIRSGNDAGEAVSGIELKFRHLLDRVLIVRPRTKAFLIGHPALFLCFLLAARRKTPHYLLVALLLLGAIGQGDLLNTFCHLHTPLVVGIWRAALGIGIGLLIGALVYAVILAGERMIANFRRASVRRVEVV